MHNENGNHEGEQNPQQKEQDTSNKPQDQKGADALREAQEKANQGR